MVFSFKVWCLSHYAVLMQNHGKFTVKGLRVLLFSIIYIHSCLYFYVLQAVFYKSLKNCKAKIPIIIGYLKLSNITIKQNSQTFAAMLSVVF